MPHGAFAIDQAFVEPMLEGVLASLSMAGSNSKQSDELHLKGNYFCTPVAAVLLVAALFFRKQPRFC